MADKKAKRRDQRSAVSLEKSAEARWNVLHETSWHVVLDRGKFFNVDKGWDREALFQAQQKYSGKDVIFKDRAGQQLYLEGRIFEDPAGGLNKEGLARRTELSKFGKGISFYRAPTHSTIASPASTEKTVPLMERPGANKLRVVKVKTSDNVLQRERRKEMGLAEESTRQQRLHAAAQGERAIAKLQLSGIGRNLTKDLQLKKDVRTRTEKAAWNKREAAIAKRKKIVVKRMPVRQKPGTMYNKRYPLAPYQYIGSSKIVRSTSYARIAHQNAKGARQTVRRLKNEMRALGKFHAKQLARDRAFKIRVERSRQFFAQMEKKRKATRAAQARTFAAKIRGYADFGKTPTRMIANRMNAHALYATLPKSLRPSTAGKRTAMASFSRQEKYPSRNLGSGAAFAASAVGNQTLIETPGRLMRGSGRGTLFTTTETVGPNRFTKGGEGGVFFRIDAEQLISNLVQKYPAAIRAAVIGASDLIGRKMLDIVEPYVPKDTGQLYMSGQTNVAQTAGGLVDMEGGEAYPSDQMYGVSISYNTAYAQLVYFDKTKAHGAAYNAKHGGGEKDERETYRWVEVALAKEKGALTGLLNEYSSIINTALNAAGISSTRSSGKQFDFQFPR